MEHGFGPSTYGDSFADVYDEWYGTAAATEAIDALAALAGDGPVLELGVGTGRIALPLAARGLVVRGIDASEQMVQQLRAKPGGDSISVTIGDMAQLELGDEERFSLVFAACNTFLNLASEDAQRRCLQRVASSLAPGGRLVIEAFVPEEGGSLSAVETSLAAADHIVLSVTRRDPLTQVVDGRHVEIGEAGQGLRLRPWRIRYLSPAQLDALAAEAGLALAERWSGWDAAPFSEGDALHVSVFRAQ